MFTEIHKHFDSNIYIPIVACVEVVEHVPSPRSFIKSCASCVKEEGHLFLSTINRTIKSNLIAIVGAEYITGIVPRGTHDWNKFLSPSELESYLNSSKFCTREIRGLVPSDILLPFKLLNNSGDLHWRLSESDLDVNYILHATMRG
jgi:2-polyprenyl-6-hydroxyphenyl methylase/3-demethylubiquinone-9 3-methyltransferase